MLAVNTHAALTSSLVAHSYCTTALAKVNTQILRLYSRLVIEKGRITNAMPSNPSISCPHRDTLTVLCDLAIGVASYRPARRSIRHHALHLYLGTAANLRVLCPKSIPVISGRSVNPASSATTWSNTLSYSSSFSGGTGPPGRAKSSPDNLGRIPNAAYVRNPYLTTSGDGASSDVSRNRIASRQTSV